MFFPVSKNTKCLKMKNLHKQNSPIHAQSSTSRVGKPLFCKDGIGGARRAFGSALTSAQLFWGRKPNPAIPAGLEAGSTGRLQDHVPASDPLLQELLLWGRGRSPKATMGKGGKGAE